MATISFARGIPAPECLPVDELADCARAAIAADGHRVLSYGPARGYPPLREWIADRHGVDVDRVVVTNGSLEGFVFLVTQLRAGARTRVLVEAPTYDRPLAVLQQLGAEVTTLPLDDEGFDPDELEGELQARREPTLLYTIPTFQNPSGVTLALERRRRTLELARSHDLLVLEDDPYGLIRFDDTPLPTLFELSGQDEGVVYSSSFSKTIAPGVRVGYLVLPRELGGAVEELARSRYISPPFLTQATVHEFLRRGRFEPNVERVRGLLRERRDAMLAALERGLAGGGARWNRPEGGYFLWLELPPGVDAGDMLSRAEADGVTYVSGTSFFLPGAGGQSSARLAFSFASPAEIAEGVSRLAALVPHATAV